MKNNLRNGILKKIFYSSALVIAMATFFAAASFGGTSINARYIEPRGNHIIWKIKVPSPPPAAVIVIQHILPGSEILESSHPLSSYDKEAGIAKWLLSSISPGTLKMDMKISKPILRKGQIHGEVMFKDESQKTTASIFLEPRTVRRAVEGC
jgi:hypothetical protein